MLPNISHERENADGDAKRLETSNICFSLRESLVPSPIKTAIRVDRAPSPKRQVISKLPMMDTSMMDISVSNSSSKRSLLGSPSTNKGHNSNNDKLICLSQKRSASITPITSPTGTSISSPVLKKKLDQAHVHARAQRDTPELPVLENLVLSISEDLPLDNASTNSNRDSVNFAKMTRSPSLRRMRVRTLDQKKTNDVASTERMKRNTDSMLEDCVIAKKLKRRLAARWQQITKRTVTCTGLSDFIVKSIMEGSLDAVAAAKSTSERLSHAADLAIEASMEGYYANMENKDASAHVKQLFMDSLNREEFNQGDFICRQNDVADKFYVIEEGTVQFSIGDLVAGTADSGSIIGEISLVYGVPQQANVQVVTQCAILWSMSALSFRQIQAVAAKESLKSANGKDSRSSMLKNLRRQVSNLTDEQECSQWKASEIHFKYLKKLAIVGKGTFGSVYVVSLANKDKTKKRFYGLKCMSKASIVERKNEKRVLIEKNILQALNSPFIISLLGTHQDDHSIYFLSEFVQGGNLMTHMINKDVLSHSESVFFCANLVSALVHVHSKGFVHRDVKPENCLIAADGYLKLCDFGMAKRLPATVSLPNGNTEVVTAAFTMCGTPEFMAPEFVLSTGYDKGVDWWALGCILVEMYAGRAPFEFDGDLKRTFREVCLVGMGKRTYRPPDPLTRPGMEVARSLAQDLLRPSSERLGRRDSAEVARHAYFSCVEFDSLMEKRITAPHIPALSHGADIRYFKKDVESVRANDEKLPEPYRGDDSWCKDF